MNLDVRRSGSTLPARVSEHDSLPEEPNYLAEAFWNQYNLITLGGLLFLGTMVSGVWFLTAAAELTYLALIPQNERFQRLVRAEYNRALTAGTRRDPEALVKKLSPRGVKRYRELEVLVKSMEDYADNVDPASLMVLNSSLNKLDYLLFSFLKLLFAAESLHNYLDEVDRASINRNIDRLQSQLETEKSERIKRVKKRNLDILEARIERLNRGIDELEFMNANLDATEDTVRLIRDRVVSSGTLDQAMGDLDLVLSDLREGERHLDEMDHLLDREREVLAAGDIGNVDLSGLTMPELDEAEEQTGARVKEGA